MNGLDLGDRLGAIGLSLGAFSTTCDIIKSISVGLEVWRRVQTLDSDLDYFRAQLILQKDILDSWYTDWYGHTTTGRVSAGHMRMLRLHHETIHSIVLCVRKELDRVDPMAVLERVGDDLSIAEQMKWVVSHRSDAEAALQRIESLLRGLYLILPLQSPHPDAQLIISMLSDRSTGMKTLLNDLVRSSSDHTMLRHTHDLQELQLELDHDLESRIRNLQHKLPDASAKIAPVSGLVPELNAAGTRSRTTLGGREVVVEWKEYRSSRGQDAIRLQGRCDNLAKIMRSGQKPVELLTLHCEGFFDDITTKRFGFVFQSPALAGEELVSLNQLFQKPLPSELPSLEQRLHLAYSLGLALSVVFAIGWLHKAIRSHNILFVRRGHDVQWSHPYLVGFAYSREDRPGALGEKLENSQRFNLYRHPNGQYDSVVPYKQAFDIYSFGVLLFEIGAWQSAFPLWSREHNADTFRRELCKPDHCKRIAHSMGTDYCNVMLSCLDGGLQNAEEHSSRSFFLQVVERLRRRLHS